MNRERYLEALRGRRVLVTGGAGFIGSHLVRGLEEAGVSWTGVLHDTPAPEQGTRVERWVRADLADADALESLVSSVQPDIVFHLAGVRGAERTLEFAERAIRGNFLISHQLLAALGRSARPRRIVLVGSSEEYGRQETLPYTEDLPARPVSPYSASKATVTQFALLYHQLFAMPVVLLRPFVIYGPGQGGGMLIPSLMEALVRGEPFPMTAGEQTRDFVYVDDVVDAMVAASIADGAVGEIFNVCSGEERRIRDVAEEAVRVAGAPVGALEIGALPYRQNEVWRLVGSNAKARRVLGWSPRVRLEDGLRRTWDAYSA
ncbi:MAG TPA: NAD-dependent epimerase/dehydratase family protein [Longimicrobiales bacterium]|nr:NAD-dependent epimerase/dehydratase family protein [Longimicrobiales bacterium]